MTKVCQNPACQYGLAGLSEHYKLSGKIYQLVDSSKEWSQFIGLRNCGCGVCNGGGREFESRRPRH